MSQALVAAGVGKIYAPATRAVEAVSFTVPAGDIAVLLGPSGCGKTTMLRMVAGLESTSEGRITCGARVFSDPAAGIFLPPQHRNLAMVFQSYAIWPHMNVAQNVEYPLRRRGLARAERAARVAEALALVGLEAYAARPAAALSGGQMQRVALARSMAYSPDLLLLDEPMSNLDPELRGRLRRDLRRIIKQVGLTALYVTHDQEEAAALADHVGVMRHGRLLQFARTEAVFGRPAHPEVARFTGARNEIAGTVAALEGAVAEIAGPDGLRLAATSVDALAVGDAVRVLFRPENLRLAPAAGAGGLRGELRERQYLGGQVVYTVALGATLIEVLESGTEMRWREGDAVALALPAGCAWAYRAG